MKSRLLRQICLPVGLGALAIAAVIGLASIVGAQTPGDTTPGATELVPTTESAGTPVETLTDEEATAAAATPPSDEATPGPDVTTVVRLSVLDTLKQPVPKGDEIEVQVSVEDVEHLAGFEFTITYDSERIEPVIVSGEEAPATGQAGTPVRGDEGSVKTANLGQVLLSGGRTRDDILCSDPQEQASTVLAACNILAAPVCAGGDPGVSGDGLLASVFFTSKGGGLTTLEISKSNLVLDDVAPPCPVSEEDDFVVQAIPHRTEGTVTIELAKDNGPSGVLIGVIVAIVVALVVVGGAAYLFYRRQQGTPSAPA